MRLVKAALAWCMVLSLMAAAHAQDGSAPAPPSVPPSLEAVVEGASAAGATVVVMTPGAPEAVAPAGTPALERAALVRNALAETFAHAPHLPSDVGDALVGAREDGSLVWLGWSLVLSAIVLIVATLARFLVNHWGRARLDAALGAPPVNRAEKVGFVMLRLAICWGAAAGFFLAGLATTLILVPDPVPARWTSLCLLTTVTLFFLLRDLMVNLVLPHAPEHRLLPITDDEASAMAGRWTVVTLVGSALLGLSAWLGGIGLDPQSHDLLRILTLVVAIALLVAFILAHRRTVGALIRGRAPRPPLVRRILADAWHILVVIYLVVAGSIQVVSIVSADAKFSVGPILGPILAFVAGFAFFGLAVIALDRRFRAQEAELTSGGPTGRAPLEDASAVPVASDPDSVQPVTVWRLRWKAYGEHIAAVASFLVGAGVLYLVWGGASAGDFVSRWLGVGFVIFFAYALYGAVRTLIDGKLADDEPAPGLADTEDGMGPGASRLGTLLPLLRNALVVSIFAVVAMVVLAGMGVDVAPLFAGAGVVGLAVGFGAQTLIRDIFSGAFFLADDAFRRGEYIDVGGVTGAVEKISLRSFQLRHHNGPLHTIPFGAINQLTNFSRDWVVMKLRLRLVYGTDIEKVRKLVKKLGQQMAADPEIGPLFIAPLKSQGVVEMEDSAMILSVKFMTKPGDQFIARRHVYTRIAELFAREGIEFASREVRVRIGNGEESAPPSPNQVAAAAAGLPADPAR